jgi:hypothetical protein
MFAGGAVVGPRRTLCSSCDSLLTPMMRLATVGP